jgi:hypothetical protein
VSGERLRPKPSLGWKEAYALPPDVVGFQQCGEHANEQVMASTQRSADRLRTRKFPFKATLEPGLQLGLRA